MYDTIILVKESMRKVNESFKLCLPRLEISPRSESLSLMNRILVDHKALKHIWVIGD